MAYLDPKTLTCPACGLTGEIIWIVGIGPNTMPGKGPAYVTLKNPGPFESETTGKITRVICPNDQTELAVRP